MTSQSPRQRETLVLPAFDSTDHLLDRPTEPGETNRRPVRAVAMRSGAIDHEDRAGWIAGKISLEDSPMREVDRSWNVPGIEQCHTAHIKQHKALLLTGAGRVATMPRNRRLRPNVAPNQPAGLISVLLNRSAPFGDRSDAAMDLSAFDEKEAAAALKRIVDDATEDPDLVEECRESLMDIQRRSEASTS